MKLIRHTFRAPAEPVRLPKYSCSDCGWSVERALVDPNRIHCERCGGNAERVRRRGLVRKRWDGCWIFDVVDSISGEVLASGFLSEAAAERARP